MRLLIIGGLGDHDRLIRLSFPVWRLYGFSVSLWPFYWQRDDGKFEERFEELLTYVDSFDKGEQICIIGTSAGGVVAALILLSRPDRVSRIVVVSSPLVSFQHYKNSLLNLAASQLRSQLTTARPDIVRRISSFRAKADSIVNPKHSILPGATNLILPTTGHIFTIIFTLTIFSKRLSEWLKNK